MSQLTVDEKLGIVSGGYSQPSPACVGSIGAIPRLGFEGICFSDGPAGYARSDLVSVFAPGITVAASWDVDLVFKRGVALGEEFRGKGAHVHLGYVSKNFARPDLANEFPMMQAIFRSYRPPCCWRAKLGEFRTGSVSSWRSYECLCPGYPVRGRPGMLQAIYW